MYAVRAVKVKLTKNCFLLIGYRILLKVMQNYQTVHREQLTKKKSTRVAKDFKES